MIDRLKEKAVFAEKVGHGGLETEYKPTSKDDLLGISLLEMQSNLLKVHQEEEKRNWASKGVTLFGDIMRSRENLELMCNKFITNLVKFLNANQAALFLAENDHDDINLKLVASYAYGRKKYLELSLKPGEGLIGECYLEKQTIFLKDVPKDYLKISSGLGEATPKNVIIVPLKTNVSVEGVLELVSFKIFESYQIAFIEKVCEDFASIILSVKNNDKTKFLLDQSQSQAELLRAQEEEMRQNMEELETSQEELQSKSMANNQTMSVFNRSNMAYVEFDLNQKVTNANSVFINLMEYGSEQEIIGTEHCDFMPIEEIESKKYKLFWENLQNGIDQKDKVKRKTKKGNEVYIDASYLTIKNSKNEVVKVIQISSNVTRMHKQLSDLFIKSLQKNQLIFELQAKMDDIESKNRLENKAV